MPRFLSAALTLLAPLTHAAEPEPIVVRCGLAAPRTAERDVWGDVLPDLPFSVERGYGYVGGTAARLEGAVLLGGASEWPAAWREGAVQYTFRLPNGDYLLRLGFVETEVAARELRVFDVLAEERQILSRLDIYREAGDFAWLERSAIVTVRDGWLDLRLVSATAKRAPRISRIGIGAVEKRSGPPAELPAPQLQIRAGPLENLLWCSPVEWRGIAGYGIFRSESADGPFESLTRRPLRVPRFLDRQVSSGSTYYYRARAYGLEGGQSPFSAPVVATAKNIRRSGLKTYELRLTADALRRMAVWQNPAVQVGGEVGFLGEWFSTDVSYDTSPGRWQRRKSLRLDMARDTYRVFRKRDEVVLSAEAGDFTQMRELLSSEAARLLGLPAPLAEPISVLVNGRFVGLRHDIELLGDRFRRRAGLDRRVGLLVRLEGQDLWRPDWEPCGSKIGKRGNLVALHELVHQLNRLHEGETEAFFRNRFHLVRFANRLAFAAVRGELDRSPSDLHLFRDAHGKWDVLRADHRHADWGVRDFDLELSRLSPEAVRRVVFPLALRPGEPLRDEWMVLFTRFFSVPSLREEYLRSLDRLVAKELGPAAFEALVDSTYARIAETAVQDPDLWPFDHGASLRRAPVLLKAAHLQRLAALKAFLQAERARLPEPVVIEGFLLRPSTGDPWVAVANRSTEPVDLSGYSVSESFERMGRNVTARRILAPGEFLRLPLRSTGAVAERREGGGVLVLWRREASRRVTADFAFYGYQSAGVSYRRTPGRTGAWAFHKESDVHQGEILPAGLTAPPYRFRQGVIQETSGDLTIWCMPVALEGGRDSKVKEVLLRYWVDGADPKKPQEVTLVWDEKRFRYSLTLEKNDARLRTAYYFLARTTDGLERAYPLGAPGLTYFLPVLPPILINEVCPRPGKGPGAAGEFIELYNVSDERVSLGGMFLTDEPRNASKWRIPAGVVIDPKGYVVVYADGLNRGLHASFRLSNSGEYLALFGRMEEGNLPIDRVAFRGVPLGQSWGRKQDGTKSFQVWKDPTPGRRNMPKIPAR